MKNNLIKKLISIVAVSAMTASLLAGCGAQEAAAPAAEPAATEEPAAEEPAPAEEEVPAAEETTAEGELPRNETLYFAGQQWGVVNSWNVIGVNQNNSMAIAGGASGYRTLMFETLYMYDPLSGKCMPLLADGDYKWNDDQTELSVKIKDAAKWSDGTDVTGADVVRTFDIGVEIGNGTGSTYGAYIDKIEADGKNITIYSALTDDGKPVNPLFVIDFLTGTPIAQAAWIDTLYERCEIGRAHV